MPFRKLLLVLGFVTLVAGIGLVALWLRTAPSPFIAQPAPQPQAMLVAARTLPAGTLLGADDIRWSTVPVAGVPVGSFVRGQATESSVTGTATRRELQADHALLADQLIRPTDPGFLPAVLGPGMRAISIAVEPAEGGAGLIAPGDKVDVILTQAFTDPSVDESYRSVGETVLRNLRVIAIDQTTNFGDKAPPSGGRLGATAESRLPKTITLEVGMQQAEVLMVAGRLGKLQLTLRSLADANAPNRGADTGPTWGADVSPALRSLDRRAPVVAPPMNVPSSPTITIDIIRGSKGERLCYSNAVGSMTNCASPTDSEPTSSKSAPNLQPAGHAS